MSDETPQKTIALSCAPWADLKGDPAKCKGCPDRGGDCGQFCTNAECYDGKVEKWTEALKKSMLKKYGTVICADEVDQEKCEAQRSGQHVVPVVITKGDFKGQVFWEKEEDVKTLGEPGELGTPGELETPETPQEKPRRLAAGMIWTHPETGEKYNVVDGKGGDCDNCDLGRERPCPMEKIDDFCACSSTRTTDKLDLIVKRIAQAEPPVAILDAPSARTKTADTEFPETGTLIMVDPDKIVKSPYQTRKVNPESDYIKELAESIKANGLLQPILVRAIGTAGYELIAGECRLTACRRAGLRPIPCMLKEMDDIEAETATNVENLQRKDLTPMEEADGIVSLIGRGKKPEEVARMLGVSEKFVYRRRVMARIVPVWRAFVETHKCCGPEFIERIARLPKQVAEKIIAEASQDLSVQQGDVAALEDIIIALERSLKGCPWAERHPEWCAACTKRSDATQDKDLFGDAEPVAQNEEPKCLDPECWKLKTTLFVREQKTELKHEYGAVLTATGTAAYNFAPQKSKTNSVPVIVTDGPSMGAVRWAPPPKPAEEKKEPKLTEQDIRKAAHWEAVAKAIYKLTWGSKLGKNTFRPRIKTLAGLAIVYGCEDYERELGEIPAEQFEKNHTMDSADSAAKNLWVGIRSQIETWRTAHELIANNTERTSSEREQRYKEALALERILDLDPEETEKRADWIYRKLYAETLKSKKGSDK